MIRFLRKMRIRDQLLAFAAFTAIVIMVIIVVTSLKISGIIVRKNNDYIRDITTQTVGSVSKMQTT